MRRAYLGLIRKEFIQVWRDPKMLGIIFAMPVVQLLLLGYAVNVDVKNITLDVYDFDRSRTSRELVSAMKAGDYFLPTEEAFVREATPVWDLDARFKDGSAEMALIISNGFSSGLARGDSVTVGVLADGADANSARTGLGYCAQIVNRYSRRVTGVSPPVEIRHRFLYNPEAESVNYMVPGIVATLLMMVTVMLTSMAIVRERETGTLEQLMVTPIKVHTLLLGKLTTFAILGLFEATLALTIGVLWFGIPFVGSPLLLFALAGLFLLTTLGMGMFFSTITSTQQQAMFLAWFFAILTSGFFTPISNMPPLIQRITYLNPMRYFMSIIRGIMMKGAGLVDLLPEIGALIVFGAVIFSFSMIRFHKRVG